MMHYKTKGTCSKEINFDIEDNIIKSVEFVGGCSGNAQGVSKLLEGMEIKDAIQRLKGIQCGFRTTSCPDQLAQALEAYVSKTEISPASRTPERS